MNPVISVFVAIPVLLGLLVIGRLLYKGTQVARGKLFKSGRKNPLANVVALLDEPFACPSCERIDNVRVARANFQQMPYVEHFLCHGCGTQYLGPNQMAMVEKRRAAREKLESILTGREPASKPPKRK